MTDVLTRATGVEDCGMRGLGCMRIATLVLAITMGCGTRGPQPCDVTGTVTLDGMPIEHGQLIFRPSDPHAAPRAATVRDGRYRVELPAGVMIVEVSSSRPAAGTPTRDMGPGYEEVVPSRYRGPDSPLSIVVTEAGENTFSLVLESDPSSSR